jgi:hypothetical protein
MLFNIIPFLLGTAFLWAAYQIIWNYSLPAIRSFCALVVILLLGGLAESYYRLVAPVRESGEAGMMVAFDILPIALAFIVYWMLVKMLRVFTLDV